MASSNYIGLLGPGTELGIQNTKWDWNGNSDSAIFCLSEENMNSYEENKMCKVSAKIKFCADLALWALAPSIKRKVLRSRKAEISFENTQIHRYALEPAGTLIFRCFHCFQIVSNDYFLFFVWFCWPTDTQIRRYADTQIGVPTFSPLMHASLLK